jgi:hypothetical protein
LVLPGSQFSKVSLPLFVPVNLGPVFVQRGLGDTLGLPQSPGRGDILNFDQIRSVRKGGIYLTAGKIVKRFYAEFSLL